MLLRELAPGALPSTRGGRGTVVAEDLADGPVGASKAQLAQLTLDAPVPPARVLPGDRSKSGFSFRVTELDYHQREPLTLVGIKFAA